MLAFCEKYRKPLLAYTRDTALWLYEAAKKTTAKDSALGFIEKSLSESYEKTPIKTNEPGTKPPPRTRLSSLSGISIRCSSRVGTSESNCDC